MGNKVEEVQRIRKCYDPKVFGTKTNVLFIGESPPCDFPKRFFYLGKGILFKATFEAFKNVYASIISEEDFLKFFASKGFYLIDLFDEPCIKLKEGKKGRKASKREVEEAKIKLRAEIESRKPKLVIVVLKRVYNEIKDLLHSLEVRSMYLRFPIGKYRKEYISILKDVLNQIKLDGS